MSWRTSSIFHLAWLQETDLSHHMSICFCLSQWMSTSCQPHPSPNLINNWECRGIGNCFIDIPCCLLRKFGCQKETVWKFCEPPWMRWDNVHCFAIMTLERTLCKWSEAESGTDDDDPEERMGRETVGRSWIGKNTCREKIGRICHLFGRIWISRFLLPPIGKKYLLYWVQCSEGSQYFLKFWQIKWKFWD